MPKGKTKSSETKTKMSDRDILRELGGIFGAHSEDAVRSLERFKRELAEAKSKLGG